jgi:hypothetical protein
MRVEQAVRDLRQFLAGHSELARRPAAAEREADVARRDDAVFVRTSSTPSSRGSTATNS